MEQKFEAWKLSNGELVGQANFVVATVKTHAEWAEAEADVLDELVSRFTSRECRRVDEKDDCGVYARHLSRMVNGGCYNLKGVAEICARDHRYLQSELFKFCAEYIKCLAEHYEKGHYDPRNEWACEKASDMAKLL